MRAGARQKPSGLPAGAKNAAETACGRLGRYSGRGPGRRIHEVSYLHAPLAAGLTNQAKAGKLGAPNPLG